MIRIKCCECKEGTKYIVDEGHPFSKMDVVCDDCAQMIEDE